MWSRKKPSIDVTETEMSPRPDALEQAAFRAMARLRGGAPRLADLSKSLPQLPKRPDPDGERALGDDPMLWSRAREPMVAPLLAVEKKARSLRDRLAALFAPVVALFGSRA